MGGRVSPETALSACVEKEGERWRRGRATMVVHTAHAFHASMPPTAPRPLQHRLPVAPMLDLACTTHFCRLTHARSPAYTARSPATPHIAHAALIFRADRPALSPKLSSGFHAALLPV